MTGAETDAVRWIVEGIGAVALVFGGMILNSIRAAISQVDHKLDSVMILSAQNQTRLDEHEKRLNRMDRETRDKFQAQRG